MTVRHSTPARRASKSKSTKPEKPHKDFPLTAHASGQWCKKVLGKIHYFGIWDEPQAALNRWLAEKDYLLAGRLPPSADVAASMVLIRDLVNAFMDAQDAKLKSGRITADTWRDYDRACDELASGIGATRALSDLGPKDFSALARSWGERWGLGRVDKFIVMTRTIFNFGKANDLFEKEVRYGSEFCQQTAREKRIAKAKSGERMFERGEILSLLKNAENPLRSMILLGLNAGMGNTDCARLPVDAVDLKRGWIKFPRPKTGIARRFPLWPETINALREWLTGPRPRPDEDLLREDDSFRDRLFLTPLGRPWVSSGSSHNPLSKAMKKLMDDAKVASGKPKRGFYTLRHVFETIGGESRDQVAVDAIMGHADGSMAAVYRERISDERLQAVVDFVRTWLYTEPKEERERPRLRIAEEADSAAESA